MPPRRRGLLASLACGLLLLAGCGGGTEVADDRTVVRLGVLPLTAVAPVYLGIEEGFFAEEGLTVEPQLAQGGAAIVPAVVSGDYEFGYSNNVSLILATAQGLPLEIVAEGNQASADADGATDAIVVPGDSDIEDADDLEGKTVGVNTLQNIGEVVIKSALEKRDVDISTMEFVETPFPEMVVAVQQGKIDAGWVVEPFVQQAKADGMRVLAHPFFETAERLSIATYFTSDRYAAENPEVVAGFTKAMNRSLEYAREHPAEVRQVTGTYTEIPPEVAESMRLTYFTQEINVDSIELLADLTARYGVVDERPAIDELMTR